MSVGELWIQNAFFPWLVMALGFWVGTSTILIWKMWYRIENLKNHNKMLQDLMMGGIRGLKQRFDQTNQSRNRSNSQRKRSKKRTKLRSERRRIKSQTPESTNDTKNGEDHYFEIPSPADNGSGQRDKVEEIPTNVSRD